jgi:hypothetical protein
VDAGRAGGATCRAAAAGGSRGSRNGGTHPARSPRWAGNAARACGRNADTDGPRESRPANRFRPGSRGSTVAHDSVSASVHPNAAVCRGLLSHRKRGAFGPRSIASAGSAAGLRSEPAYPDGCASAPARGETGGSGSARAVPHRASGSGLERAGVWRRRG